MSTRPRFIVIGAGAVGAALALGLTLARHDVVLVARGAVYARARSHGLTVRWGDREQVIRGPLADGPDGVQLRATDILLLTVKSQDAREAVEVWAAQPVATDRGVRRAGEVLPIVTFQNGRDTDRVALRRFEQVVAATTLIAARHTDAGVVETPAGERIGRLILGPFPSALSAPRGAAEVTRALAEILRSAAWAVQTSDDIDTFKAWKTVEAATFAAEVLAGSPVELDDLRGRIRAEGYEVFGAAGIDVADVASPERKPGGRPRLSTWQSFQRGSGSEVDYLAGEIVLEGRLHGIPVPVTSAVQRVLADAEGAPPGTRTVTDVLERIHDDAPAYASAL